MAKRSFIMALVLFTLFSGTALATTVVAKGYVYNWLSIPVEDYEVSVGYWGQFGLLATRTATTDASGYYQVSYDLDYSGWVTAVTWVSPDGQAYFAADRFSCDLYWFPLKKLSKDPGENIMISKAMSSTGVTLDRIKALYR